MAPMSSSEKRAADRVDGEEIDAGGSDAARQIEAKLELIGAIALLSVTTAMRSLEARAAQRGGELTQEERGELERVRSDLRTSLEALDAQMEESELAGVDLSGLREKVARTLRTLDQWPAAGREPS